MAKKEGFMYVLRDAVHNQTTSLRNTGSFDEFKAFVEKVDLAKGSGKRKGAFLIDFDTLRSMVSKPAA